MTVRRKGVWLLASLVVVALTYLAYRGEVIVLSAEEDVLVLTNPLAPPAGGNTLHVLRKGERANVLRCEDLKTDLVLHVRVRTGETGYVRMGRFILERRKLALGLLLSDPRQLTFSCKGMFEHPTVSRYLD